MRLRDNIWILLAAGLVLRLLFTPYLTYQLDLNTYIAWSNSLLEVGFKNFLKSNWVDYLPGYHYILWFIAWLRHILAIESQKAILMLYKLPAILADLATGFLIYQLLKKERKDFSLFTFHFSLSTAAAALYLFNPAIFANSSLWGQTDSFTALFAFLSLFLILQPASLLAGISLGLGTLIKPSTVLIAPVLGLVLLKDKKFFKQTLLAAISTVILFLAGFAPFTHQPNLASFALERIKITINQYTHTSLNAFNFWFLADGSWQSDQETFLGFTKHLWGNLTFLAIYGLVCLKLLFKKRQALNDLVQAAGLGFTAAFLLLTRMHERHLLPAFPFLLVAALLQPRFIFIYIWFSLSYLVNLVFGFQFGPGNVALISLSPTLAKIFSGLNLLVLGIWLVWLLTPRLGEKFWQWFKQKSSKTTFQQRGLILLLAVSFLVRIVRLGVPSEYYFDEVYHAFTAQEILQGNPKAWEWWNTPPEGVAYEWTHPPLAKHFMVLSMQLFGKNPFAWRLPGVILGTTNILLVYLLARELFVSKNLRPKTYHLKTIPLLAAGLYSVESLSFVQSRIGMNDTYMLFFVLLSLLSLLRKKYPASALSFALALASKWSAIYLAPVLLVTFVLKEKFNLIKSLKIGAWYLVIPTCIYLLVYLPFFTTGHTWSQFVELQKQMYWYHTRLEASHDYASPWWSWPIMLRPVWYYVKYAEGTIANIYALGNPIIFWGGLIAIFYTILNLLKQPKNKKYLVLNTKYLVLLAGYASFLLPWALSPRIMFLYHYLPSIPFMVILIAWVLAKLWSRGAKQKKAVLLFLVFSFSFFVFYYPHLTALPVSRDWAHLYFWLPSWK